jgi:hypothetical protein
LCRVGGEVIVVTDFGILLGVVDIIDHVAGIIAAMGLAGGVDICMASASTVAAAAVGGSAATTAAAAASTAVAAMRGSSRRGSRTVVCWLVLVTYTIGSAICWGATATSGFMVSSESDFVVDSHEVGVLGKPGDDFTCAVLLGLACYRGDRHKALPRVSVHLVGDLIKSLI